MNKTIAISVAMSAEYALMREALDNPEETKVKGLLFCKARLGNNTVVLAKSGVGKVNAAVTGTVLVYEFAPDCMISTGVAGGLDKSINIGDVVLGAYTCYHDVYVGEEVVQKSNNHTGKFPADACLLKNAGALQEWSGILKSGLICTGDQFIDNRDKLREIKNAYPEALAVDMESCSLAQVCDLFSVPFLSLRIISDTPYADKHLENYKNFFDKAPHTLFNIAKSIIKSII